MRKKILHVPGIIIAFACMTGMVLSVRVCSCAADELENDRVILEDTAIFESYDVPEGWQELTEAAAGGKMYRQISHASETDTSQISCSREATEFSVLEYEQLRDLLTDQVIYEDVNAVVSSSCSYTDNQDNLFILTSDDVSREYRDIYYYIVRDFEYFCVRVKEYRAEADQARAEGRDTPEEAARKMATQLTW